MKLTADLIEIDGGELDGRRAVEIKFVLDDGRTLGVPLSADTAIAYGQLLIDLGRQAEPWQVPPT